MANRLSRIVTRTGDSGTTGLSDGSRVDKDAPRMEAIGTIDELNSFVGFAESQIDHAPSLSELREALQDVQHDLFDLGGALSLPGTALLSKAHVDRIEAVLERLNTPLPPLKDFVLPGGNAAIAALHAARCICRRAERRLITLFAEDPQDDPHGKAYLNRLSDLMFVAARTVARSSGVEERIWRNDRSLS